MQLVDNDRWSGSIRLDRNARHRYAIEAWRDGFGSVRAALLKKVEAQVELATELAEMRVLLEAALLRARGHGRAGAGDATLIEEALAVMRRARSDAGRAAAVSGEELLAAVRRHPDRSAATRSAELPLMVDRERARFGAWYELFPRSQGRDPQASGGDHVRRRDLAPAGDRARSASTSSTCRPSIPSAVPTARAPTTR